MALNFVVSYTFSPSTTIASAQVNTNTNDVASVFQGLEAVTKSFARLQVDAVPSVAADVVRKDYVDRYAPYRRPTLTYVSGTVVSLETGISGTSGQAQVLFPDGNLRTDSTTSRIQATLTQNAVLSGTAQGGLRTGSVANNTWYCYYAVKTSDNSSNFVLVADVVVPIQANFATLNSNFGTNSWEYIGTAPYGDNSGTATAVPVFAMYGNMTIFDNALVLASAGTPGRGVRLATTAGAANLTYTFASGTTLSSGQLPVHLRHVTYAVAEDGQRANGGGQIANANSTFFYAFVAIGSSTQVSFPFEAIASDGVKYTVNTGTPKIDIFMPAYKDSVLGIGSNPLL